MDCVEIKIYGTFVLNQRVDLHAIDVTPARWWRCRFVTTRRSQHGRVIAEKRLSEELSGAPDALVDFHTGPYYRA